MLKFFAVWAFVVTVAAKIHFNLTECGHSANKLVSINSLHLSADPIHIPGNETIDVDIEILRRIADHHFQVKLDLFKHMFMDFIHFPCPKSLHNCTAELCTALGDRGTHNCPAEIEESTPTFPCKCPIEPGRYHLNPTTFQIPVLSGLMQYLAEGEYRIEARVTDTNTQEEVACYKVHFATEGECHNAACIIGGIIGRK